MSTDDEFDRIICELQPPPPGKLSAFLYALADVPRGAAAMTRLYSRNPHIPHTDIHAAYEDLTAPGVSAVTIARTIQHRITTTGTPLPPHLLPPHQRHPENREHPPTQDH